MLWRLISSLTTLVFLIKNVSTSNFDRQHGPMFTSQFSREKVFLNTEGGILPCSAYGLPKPDIDWIAADGKKLVKSAGLLEFLSNGSLYFVPFREEMFDQRIHAAKVRCRATNVVGSIISPEIQVKSVRISRYQKYNVQLNDVYVTLNNTAILQCSVNPYYLQKYVVVTAWIQNGEILKPGERYSLMSSGELHVRHIMKNDTYSTYKCVTRNLLTAEQKTSDSAHLIVVDSVNSGPVMKNALSTVSANRGSKVELPCVANGVPLPQFLWSKNGAPLAFGKGKFSLRGGNLVAAEVDIGDGGSYTCVAKNDFGQTSATFLLEVSEPLRVFVEPSELTADLNRSAVFNCAISGHPVKSVEWFKDGVPVSSADGQHQLSGNRTLLIISQVQRQDAGMYQCMVSNDEDAAQGSARLLSGVARPSILKSAEEEYSQVGHRVSLRCTATGNPLPFFQWMVDGSPVVNGTRVTVSGYASTAGEMVSYMNISSVSIEDGGTYRCTAQNKAGSDFLERRLNVYGIPFIRPMTDVTAVANELLTLPCHVTGYPVQRISWFKGNIRLPINHRQYIRPNGALAIEALDRYSDEGSYVCDARDATGQGMNRSVYVRIMDPPKIDPFQFPRRKQGDRASISCAISSGDLPLNISWLKDGLSISHDSGITIQKTGAYSSLLSISYVDPSYGGNYTCVASNSAASANHTAQLHVNVPPQWRMEPENSAAVLGQSVLMDCQTDGDPVPLHVWKRSAREQMGQYVPLRSVSGPLGDRLQLFENGSLSIREVELSDDGYYLCQASNGVGPDLSKVVLLSIHVPAKFKLSERNYTVRLDENVAIECVADGDLPLTIVWSYNLDVWQDSSRMRTTLFDVERGRGSQLVISSVRREDTGFYVCKAENSYGTDVSIVQLIVMETADPPENLVVMERSSNRAKLRWTVGFDGNSPITGYMIQMRNDGGAWENMTAVAFDSGVPSANVMGLKPAMNYQARIMAANRFGFGNPSNVVTFRTAESAPSAPPSDIEVKAVGPQSLRITWKPPPEDSCNGKIIGYHIGYKKNATVSPYFYITKRSEESWVLENLEKFTTYAIHIQAFTAVGSGPRSEDILTVTLEDVPSHYPEEMKAVAISSERIQVSWVPPPPHTVHGIIHGYRIVYRLARDDEDETSALSVVTKELSTVLVGLRKYTNYSIQALAYTRMGEGISSPPLHVMTLEDAPDAPADVKVVVAGSDKVLVSWKPPLHANGIITKYTLYHRDITSTQIFPKSVDLDPLTFSHLVSNLSLYFRYGFRISASTSAGESEPMREIIVSITDKVGARIASFSTTVYAHWYDHVFLHCLAVGVPAPNIFWRKRGIVLLSFGGSHQVLANGTLALFNVQSSDAAEYTCRAENENGADEISVSLVVQVAKERTAPPHAPVLSAIATSSSIIQVSWRTASNGGSRIKGFSLFYRRESHDWASVDLGPNNRSYIAGDLSCGSEYSFYIRARNEMGEGIPSNVVHVKTGGSSPIMPPQSMILSHINSTFVVLSMDTWLTAECPILFYDIQFQVYGDTEWYPVDRTLQPNITLYRIDLHPSTWYIVKVTAHSSAGSTDCVLKFATKSYFGATIQPLRIEHRIAVPFYKNVYVMLSASVVFVFFVITSVAVGLYCHRWRLRKRYRAAASRMRQDPKSAFLLQSDAAKSLAVEAEERQNAQTYVAAPSLTYSALKLLSRADVGAIEREDDAVFQESVLHDEGSFSRQNRERVNEDRREGTPKNRSRLTQEDDVDISPYATFPLSHHVFPVCIPNRYDSLSGTQNLPESALGFNAVPTTTQEITDDSQKIQYQNIRESLPRGSDVPTSSSSFPRKTRGVRSSRPPTPPVRRTLVNTREVHSEDKTPQKD